MLPAVVSPRAVALCALAATLLSACYDHRVTQAILERRRAAKAAEGATIKPAGGSVRPIAHNGRVKLYVAADFRKQHADWKQQLLDLVDEANSVLGPEFALRLEVTQAAAWEPQCDPARMDDCLDELMKLDHGAPDEWVVGVLGALPRFTTSFDELGYASVEGRHFLLRDVSDLQERDAIERAFPGMLPSRRDEIYRHRKHHKRMAVFLHEWGHTLGAQHVPERSALLHASYDDDMKSYGSETSAIIAAALPARFASGGEDAAAAGQAEPAPGRSAAKPSTSQAVQNLAPADLARFRSAESLANEGSAAQAYAELEPLVERYPAEYAVQQLACRLLMQLGRAAEVQTVCTRLQQLGQKAAR
jgi:hypothetical protein